MKPLVMVLLILLLAACGVAPAQEPTRGAPWDGRLALAPTATPLTFNPSAFSQFRVTPDAAAPTQIPLPTPTAPSPLADLAYIRAMAWPYSDDADPAHEGFYIDVDFYDSKSEGIDFMGVPVQVAVKVWSAPRPMVSRPETEEHLELQREAQQRAGAGVELTFGPDEADEPEATPVYRQEITVDSSFGLSLDRLVKIPFGDVEGPFIGGGPFLEVTATTPDQRTFKTGGDWLVPWPGSQPSDLADLIRELTEPTPEPTYPFD